MNCKKKTSKFEGDNLFCEFFYIPVFMDLPLPIIKIILKNVKNAVYEIYAEVIPTVSTKTVFKMYQNSFYWIANSKII